jgi:hypothetical protein
VGNSHWAAETESEDYLGKCEIAKIAFYIFLPSEAKPTFEFLRLILYEK